MLAQPIVAVNQHQEIRRSRMFALVGLTQSLNFNVTPVTFEFEMAEWMVKPQGDHTLANEKLGQSCVLVFDQTEIRVPPGLNYLATRCRDVATQ